jgi:site-specific recombinase XerC
MESVPLLDCAGRRRSPATTSSFHEGLPPRNKGLRYPPDPPTVAEIVAVMRAAGDSAEGVRLRSIIVVLWRAGLRISEALTLSETDLDSVRGSLVRATSAARSEWIAGRGRTWIRGWNSEESYRSVDCSALCGVRHGAGRAQRRASVRNCTMLLRWRVFGVGSRLISSGMRMRLRCHGRASR